MTLEWTDEFYGIVDDLDDRPELALITDSQNVDTIKQHIGNPEWANGYYGFFVEVIDGDYGDIYGFEHIIPYSTHPIYRIYQKLVED